MPRSGVKVHSSKGIGGQILKFHFNLILEFNFLILITDLDSLQKSRIRTCAFFYYILMRTKSNSALKSQFGNLETLVLNLIVFSSENGKKKHTFLSYFFARSPNLQSEFENSDF